MSGFWYTAVIATTASALFVIAGTLGTPRENIASKQAEQTANQATQKSSQAADLISAENEQKLAQAAVIKKNTDRANYEQAIELARQAVDAYQSAQASDNLEVALVFTRREKALWRDSIEKLSAIPRGVALYQQANDKKAQYKNLLATAEQKVLTADSAFLSDIVSDAQLSSEGVHITLCQIDAPSDPIKASTKAERGSLDPNTCRHYQGEQLLASPASLIKLPIAIALLDKAHSEDIDLDSKLYIDPDNFTENAIGATIEVDKEYSLVHVMSRMIDESNNIATNQLIDYVGREDIAKTLAKQGYQDTFVDHKLAGDRILPPNAGTQSNRITTDDITTMMVNTYRLSCPGDEALLQALLSQKDQELGYQALQEVGTAVEWMGEKTGQNDRLLGSTLAMKIDGKRYALTVAIDYSGDPVAIRDLVKGVASYLIESGPIVASSDMASDLEPDTAQTNPMSNSPARIARQTPKP
ncbi:MAG: serine hydrolase [Phormidesmis sp.]